MSFLATEVVFKVFCKLGHGEDVRLGGNVGILGLYDTSRTIKLSTSTQEYPWWSTVEALELSGDPNLIQYRFCIFSGGIFQRWETVEARQLLNVSGICVKGVGLTESHFDVPQPDEDSGDMRRSPLSLQYFDKQRDFNRENAELELNDVAIMVSYFLPVTLSKEHDKWVVTPDLDHILSFPIDFMDHVYTGNIRFEGKDIPHEDRVVVSRLLKEHNCHPIYIDDTQHDLVYNQLLEQHLKALLQCKRNPYSPLEELLENESTTDLWVAYNAFLRHLTAKIVELFHSENYLIWIHGYELLRLPSMMRRKLPKAKIGYFFHSPFPPADTWLAINKRAELLKGVLGANQIGFHTHESAGNFMTATCRILGFNYYPNHHGKLCINVDGNEVCVTTAIHKGVDIVKLYEICDHPQFIDDVKRWRKKFGERTVISGMRFFNDPYSILEVRGAGVEQLLDEHPELRGKILFVMIGMRPEAETTVYRETRDRFLGWVQVINNRYGCECIHFEEFKPSQMVLSERMALFGAMDVFMHSSLENGTLKFAMEYTVACYKCRQIPALCTGPKDTNKIGVLIGSAHRPISRILPGTMRIFTRDPAELKQLVLDAVNMSKPDSDLRLYKNMSTCAYHTATVWADIVLTDLKSTEQAEGTPNLTNATSLGSQSFWKDLIGQFKPLDTEELYESYRATQSRLILLNGDSFPELNEDQRHMLEALSVDKKNIVFLVSSKSQQEVDEKYGKYISLGLAAEHGYYFRWPQHKFSAEKLELVTQSKPASEWQTTMQHLDRNWQKPTIYVMKIFTNRTVHSYMEVYEHSIEWQFGDTDPEFGYLQSKELEEYLISILDRNEVDIIRGYQQERRYIQVRTKRISKAQFLENVLLTLRSVGNITDFILAVGDDESDEPLFRKANGLDMPLILHDKKAVFTTVIGKRRSCASVCVETLGEILQVLKRLSRNAVSETKFYSTSDLDRLATSKK
eukprot:gene31664-39115_t